MPTASNPADLAALDQLIERQGTILNHAAEAGRDLTPAEVAELERLGSEFDRANARRMVDEYRAGQPRQSIGRRTDPDPIGQFEGSDGTFQARPGALATGRWGARPRAHVGPSSVIYAGQQRDSNGFRDARDFFASALSGRYDIRFENAGQQMGEMTGEQGGFMVPFSISADLVSDIFAASNILPLVKTFKMDSRSVQFPRYQSNDRSTGLLAGFEGRWQAEAVDGSLQRAKVEALSVTANKLSIYSSATRELLEDSPIFVQSFQPMLAKAAAYSLDRALVRGTGAGQPLGMLNDTALITIAAEAAQVADTVLYPNLVKMYAAMYSAGVSRAVWLVHPSTLPQLLQVKDVVKNVAGTENVGGSSVVGTAGGNLTLIGRPVVITEALNPVGDLGDILLVDPSQYGYFLRSQLHVDTTNAQYWLSDEISFRLTVRCSGCGLWTSAAKRPGDANPSESWVIALAAR